MAVPVVAGSEEASAGALLARTNSHSLYGAVENTEIILDLIELALVTNEEVASLVLVAALGKPAMLLEALTNCFDKGGTHIAVVDLTDLLLRDPQLIVEEVNHAEAGSAADQELTAVDEHLGVANLLPGVTRAASVAAHVDFALTSNTDDTGHVLFRAIGSIELHGVPTL